MKRYTTKPLDRTWLAQVGIILSLIGLAGLIGLLFHIVLPAPAAAADQGYFNCLHLEESQRAWFASAGIKTCCDLSDGMPVRFEERPEGVFVPPFTESRAEALACKAGTPWGDRQRPGEDHSHWVLVYGPVVLRKNNPIGVGVIWWTNSAYDAGPSMSHTVRCFVGLPRV